ncbi:c-type cytochrome [Camelimonas sp. ID_303_24]
MRPSRIGRSCGGEMLTVGRYVGGMKRLLIAQCAIAASISLLLLPKVASASELAAAGRSIAEANCSRCHATGMAGTSPHNEAPPFRDLAKRYPIDSLAEAFAEGLSVGHADMPEFKLSAKQTDALLAYLQSIQTSRSR